MIEDLKQHELDVFEEAVLNDLWGGTKPTAKANVAMAFAGVDPQNVINGFEAVIKPIMTEQGLVKGSLLKDLISLKYPKVLNWMIIPEEEFRLIDEYQGLSPFVKFIGSKLR